MEVRGADVQVAPHGRLPLKSPRSVRRLCSLGVQASSLWLSADKRPTYTSDDLSSRTDSQRRVASHDFQQHNARVRIAPIRSGSSISAACVALALVESLG